MDAEMTQESTAVKLRVISSKVLLEVHIKMIFLLLILEALKYVITVLLSIFLFPLLLWLLPAQ